jgi:hypothetical protein
MKTRFILMVVLALMVGALALPAGAQDMAKKDTAVKSAPSPSQAVLAAWNEIGRKLIAMAEDFPEDEYNFKPRAEQRGFSEQLLHAAGSCDYFTDVAQGRKPTDDEARDHFKTKADVVAYVKKQFAAGADLIKAKGDQGMSEIVTDAESNQPIRVSDLAYGLIEHSGEHYGQLVVYYRLLYKVPPESRPKDGHH